MRRVGLTGGIGAGKSTVAALWVAHGATLIDTDAISRALTAAGGAAIPALRQAFGDRVIDAGGALDRAAMRALAFTDDSATDSTGGSDGHNARSRLESILHPLIGAECARQAQQASGPFVVFDVPLLVESGRWRTQVERVLVVDAEPATQIERVMARSGWSRQAVEQVMARQASRAARRAAADAVIYNEGKPREALAHEVEQLWRRWSAVG